MSWAEDEDEGIDAYDGDDIYRRKRPKRKHFVAEEDDFQSLPDDENDNPA